MQDFKFTLHYKKNVEKIKNADVSTLDLSRVSDSGGQIMM